MTKTFIVAAAALVASGVVSAASAQTLKPIKAEIIELGGTHGSAYFVPEADGYHLVATLASGDAQPIRFNTVLADGQSASVSVPGPSGGASKEVTFQRTSEQLIVRQSQDAAVAATQ